MPTEKKITGYDLAVKMRKARRKYPLTATEQALFYELVAICNEEDWEEVFTASNEELYRALNISENTLSTARVALINARLVYYQNGKSKRVHGKYSFTKRLTTSKSDTNTGTNKGTNPGVNTGVNAATVDDSTTSNFEDSIKQYSTTETETKTETSFSGDDAPGDESNDLKTDPEKKEKSSAQKEKRVPTEHWKALVSEWHSYYARRFNNAVPSFDGEPATSLRKLMVKIKARVEAHPATADSEWNQINAVHWLRLFLDRAWEDGWLRDNFLLPVLNSKFDSIVDRQNGKSNSKNGQPGGILNEDAKRSIADRLAKLTGQSG